MRAEKLAELIKDNSEHAHLLQLKTVVSRGSSRTSKFPVIPGRLHHCGGAVVIYILYSDKGSILASGSVARRSKSRRFKWESNGSCELPGSGSS